MPTTVLAAFQELISRQSLTANQRDVAATRITGIGDYFSDNFQMAAKTFSVGSYARGTLCRAERDIDLMAPFAYKYWERYEENSQTFLYWVRGNLNDHYWSSAVSSKRVAVTLDFNTIAVDLVPCFRREGGGYLMPNGEGKWQKTNPPYHTELINTANTNHSDRLKTLIKLVKAWNIANTHHLRSFHLELMIERMLRKYSINKWAGSVAAVLKALPGWVESPFYDPWNTKKRIDDYLSDEERSTVVSILKSDAASAAKALEYAQAGETEKAFERWQVIYNHTFPAYG